MTRISWVWPHFEDPGVIDSFLEFVGDANIVAHNASFDRGFLNAELARAGYDIIPEERWVDTLAIAKAKFPGAPASLDALCKRFDISNEHRVYHGALLDSQLLADVYLELLGGRARSFDFEQTRSVSAIGERPPAEQRGTPIKPLITPEEEIAHKAFVKEALGEKALWNNIES